MTPHTNGKFYKHICKEMKLTSLIMKQIYFLCYTAAFIFHRNTGTVLSMRTPLSFRKIKERFTSYPNLFIIAHLSSGTNYGQSAFCQNVVLWYLSSQPWDIRKPESAGADVEICMLITEYYIQEIDTHLHFQKAPQHQEGIWL